MHTPGRRVGRQAFAVARRAIARRPRRAFLWGHRQLERPRLVPSSVDRARKRSPPLRSGRAYSRVALTAAHLLREALLCVSPCRNSSTIRRSVCSRGLGSAHRIEIGAAYRPLSRPAPRVPNESGRTRAVTASGVTGQTAERAAAWLVAGDGGRQDGRSLPPRRRLPSPYPIGAHADWRIARRAAAEPQRPVGGLRRSLSPRRRPCAGYPFGDVAPV